MVFQELVSSRSLDWVSCHTSGRGGEGGCWWVLQVTRIRAWGIVGNFLTSVEYRKLSSTMIIKLWREKPVQIHNVVATAAARSVYRTRFSLSADVFFPRIFRVIYSASSMLRAHKNEIISLFWVDLTEGYSRITYTSRHMGRWYKSSPVYERDEIRGESVRKRGDRGACSNPKDGRLWRIISPGEEHCLPLNSFPLFSSPLSNFPWKT